MDYIRIRPSKHTTVIHVEHNQYSTTTRWRYRGLCVHFLTCRVTVYILARPFWPDPAVNQGYTIPGGGGGHSIAHTQWQIQGVRGVTPPPPEAFVFVCQFEISYGPAFWGTLNPPSRIPGSEPDPRILGGRGSEKRGCC